MKIYIASALSNDKVVKHIAAEIIARGHVHTYDWTVHGSLQHSPSRWLEVAGKEANGVLDADAVIVVLPGGRGTHTELGIALGSSKRVILFAEHEHLLIDEKARTCIFYHHERVETVRTIEALWKALEATQS